MAGKKFGLQQIAALVPGQLLWDGGEGGVKGFGARRQQDAVAYVLKYRTTEGRQRWFTIGRHGSPWTPATARAEAQRLLAKVSDERDPALEKAEKRKAETVAQLCDQYLSDADEGRLVVRRKRKKASTIATDRGRIERHIKPLLGHLKVRAVKQQDVFRFMNDVATGKSAARTKTKARGVAHVTGGEGTASRTVGLLGGIFTYAVQRGMCSTNPVHGVERFPDQVRERRLSDTEYLALGKALDVAEAAARQADDCRRACGRADPIRRSEIWWPALQCIRFLALTGWRRGEALSLRWNDIDFRKRTALLLDTKTGVSARVLSDATSQSLQMMEHLGDLVFPAAGGGVMGGMTFNRYFDRLKDLGRLEADVTPHVLRHSFASVARDLEYSDSTVAALLGHGRHSVTAGYMHASDSALQTAATAVAGKIANLMTKAAEGADLPRSNA